MGHFESLLHCLTESGYGVIRRLTRACVVAKQAVDTIQDFYATIEVILVDFSRRQVLSISPGRGFTTESSLLTCVSIEVDSERPVPGDIRYCAEDGTFVPFFASVVRMVCALICLRTEIFCDSIKRQLGDTERADDISPERNAEKQCRLGGMSSTRSTSREVSVAAIDAAS